MMPIYLFWGEDDYAIARAVAQLRDKVVDPVWKEFNETKIPGDRPEAVLEAIDQARTPPFGTGERFVWLWEAAVCQQCSPELLAEIERTLPAIPDSSTLVLTTSKKLDKRLKSTKLWQAQAQVREYSPIPPWKTEEIRSRIQEAANEKSVRLTPEAIDLLCDSVGNDTRQLHVELDKLSLYEAQLRRPLAAEDISALVAVNTQTSLQLADAIRVGDAPRALSLVADLLARNEPALRIVATLSGRLRMWLRVKLEIAAGQTDEKAIARSAGVGNPKRIYILRKEVQPLTLDRLLAALPLLLELEVSLKRGAEPLATLQAKAIELCLLCRPQ